jgi:hypothetical protein
MLTTSATRCIRVLTCTSMQSLRWYGPSFSPKDVPRFYDVSGLTENPVVFRQVFYLCLVLCACSKRAFELSACMHACLTVCACLSLCSLCPSVLPSVPPSLPPSIFFSPSLSHTFSLSLCLPLPPHPVTRSLPVMSVDRL